MLSNANKLVHFGWKKEAIPVSQPKKSIIARVFEAFWLIVIFRNISCFKQKSYFLYKYLMQKIYQQTLSSPVSLEV